MFAECLLELVFARAVGRAHLDKFCSGHGDLAIILVAMARLDQYLGLHAFRVGQLLRLRTVRAGETSGCAQHNGGRCPWGDAGPFSTKQSGDVLTRCIQKVG